MDRARVHVEAARLVGAEDPGFTLAIERALDERLPNRKEAIAARKAIDFGFDSAWLALLDRRQQAHTLMGDQVRAARASMMAKDVKYHADPENYSETVELAQVGSNGPGAG